MKYENEIKISRTMANIGVRRSVHSGSILTEDS